MSVNDEPTVKVDTAAGRDALAERYDNITELGRGGMGIVFRARDRQSGDTVAVKVLRAEVMADADAVQRFTDELVLARRITHKNVCRVYEINRFGPIAAISMEYVPGESLRELLNHVGSLSIRHATNILSQILDGLAEAHAQGVIHRDLKPENILIDRHGVVKIMDFGIARVAGSHDRTMATSVIGTPAYMSPEQIAGKPVDGRSDLYALGLMMYEMFLGQRAFAADDPVVLMAKQSVDVPPRPRDVDPDLPLRIEKTILGCLEKSPDRRWSSAAEVKRALIADDTPRHVTPARADSLPAALLHWQRSDWGLLGAAIVGAALFVPLFTATTLHHQNQLTFDPAAVSQIGRDYRARLGVPPSPVEETGMWFYWGELAYAARIGGHQQARAIAGRDAQVFTWTIRFVDRSYMEIDPQGRLRLFSLNADPIGTQPLPEATARATAEQAARDWFQVEPRNLTLIGNSAFGGRTTYNWEQPEKVAGLIPRYTIGVTTRGVEAVSRFLASPIGAVAPWRPSLENWYAPITIVIVLILTAAGFAVRRRTVGVEPWHVGFAIPVGIAGAIVGLTYFSGSGQTGSRLVAATAVGFTITATWILCCALIERLVSRWDARKLTSIRLLCSRGAWTSPVGLAIVRGAMVGVVLLALDTAGAWVATRYLGATLDYAVHIWFVGLGLRAGAVAPIVVTIVQMVWVGSFVAVATALARQWVTPRTPAYPIVAAAVLGLTGSHFSMASFIEPQFVIAQLFLDFLVLTFAFQRFDLLTVFVAVLTFVLGATTAPLLMILEQGGARGPQLLIALWMLIVLAAPAATAQGSIRMIYRRATAAID